MKECPKCQSSNVQYRGDHLYCADCKKYTKFKKHQQEEVEYSDNHLRIITTSERINSLDDVIRHFKINTNEWQVEKVRTKTSEGYRKDRSVTWKVRDGKVLEGDVNDTGGMLVVPMYHMEVLFKRKTEVMRARLEIESLLRDAKAKTKKRSIPRQKSGLLFEIDFPDLHFGKLTWEEESGENYDVKIASQVVEHAINQLIRHAHGQKIGRILLPLGNDFFNVDNKSNETTHGTPQQEDTRWAKTFRLGRKLATEIIDGLSEIAPVDVVIVPGNHDETRMFYLGDVLDVKYSDSARVTVNNSAMKRKYYKFGNVLLGLTHGYHEKFDKLSFIMATERPDDWAKTVHREWHLGDKHHKKDLLYGAEDVSGVTIRLLRSLSATDAWHFDKGFIGAPRGAEAFLWDAGDGLIAQYHTTVKK